MKSDAAGLRFGFKKMKNLLRVRLGLPEGAAKFFAEIAAPS